MIIGVPIHIVGRRVIADDLAIKAAAPARLERKAWPVNDAKIRTEHEGRLRRGRVIRGLAHRGCRWARPSPEYGPGVDRVVEAQYDLGDDKGRGELGKRYDGEPPKLLHSVHFGDGLSILV